MTSPDGLVERLSGQWFRLEPGDGDFRRPRKVRDDAPNLAAARIEALTAEVDLLRSLPDTDQWRLDGSKNVDLAFKIECIRRSLQYWLSWDRKADHNPADIVIPPTWPSRAVIAIWVTTLQEAEQAARSLSRTDEGEG